MVAPRTQPPGPVADSYNDATSAVLVVWNGVRRFWSADLKLDRKGTQGVLLAALTLLSYGWLAYILTVLFHFNDALRIFYPLEGRISDVAIESPRVAATLATMMKIWIWVTPALGLVDMLFYTRIMKRPFPWETVFTIASVATILVWVWPVLAMCSGEPHTGVEILVDRAIGAFALAVQHVPTLIRFNGIVALVVAVAIADFTYYWTHRLSHSIRVFWNLGHINHHRIRDLTAITGPFEPASRLLSFAGTGNLFRVTLVILITKLITVDFHSAYWGIIFFLALDFWLDPSHSPTLWFLESRVPGMRWVRWVFVTPGVHAIHHSRMPEHNLADGCNFAVRFSFWDRLFGTYAEPAKEAPIPDLGLFDEKADYCVGAPLRFVFRPYVRMSLELRRNHVRHWPAIFFGRASYEPPVVSNIPH